jgi:hypothetical protein
MLWCGMTGRDERARVPGENPAGPLGKQRVEDRLEIRGVVDNRLISVQNDRSLPIILNITSLVGL